MRTAVLSKNNMVALLCVKTANEGGAICRVDPRETNPSVQIYDDPEKAIEWFNEKFADKQEKRLASRLRRIAAARLEFSD